MAKWLKPNAARKNKLYKLATYKTPYNGENPLELAYYNAIIIKLVIKATAR